MTTTPARPAPKPAANAPAPQPAAKPIAKTLAPAPTAKPAAKALVPPPVAKPAAKAPAPPLAAKPAARAPLGRPVAKPLGKAPFAPPAADTAKRAEPAAKPAPARAIPVSASRFAKAAAAAGAGVITGASAAISSRIGDLALIGSGVATATAAVTFAGVMLMQGDHAPNINGMQYLAVFAQPSKALRPGDPATPLSTAAAAAHEPQATVDMEPVGAISARPMPHPNYELISAGMDRAWVRDGDRIFAVHIGDDVPNLGKIEDIVWTDGHWALIGADKVALLASGEAAAPKKNGAGGLHQKKMIFGTDQ